MAGAMTKPLYLRPIAFVDSPFGNDGLVARLAGGLLWFSAVELIRREGPGQTTELIPVEAFERLLDNLQGEEQEAARVAWSNLTAPRAPIQLGERTIRLDQPQIVGIVNATPDSFSDAGRFGGDASAAADAGFAMAAAGAAIVDVGGESTRPGATTIWEEDEKGRVTPVIEQLLRGGTAVSLDSRKAAVMEAVLGVGPVMINDVSALTFDARSAEIVAAAACPVVLMHHQGPPETMQQSPHYAGPVPLEVYDWLDERIEAAVAAGINRSRIVIDPGFGFGKNLQHNLQLMNGLSLLHGLGCPIMLGASRKRTIGALSSEEPADQRVPGSITLALKGLDQGVQLLRVHDVPETVQAVKVWRGLRDSALTPR